MKQITLTTPIKQALKIYFPDATSQEKGYLTRIVNACMKLELLDVEDLLRNHTLFYGNQGLHIGTKVYKFIEQFCYEYSYLLPAEPIPSSNNEIDWNQRRYEIAKGMLPFLSFMFFILKNEDLEDGNGQIKANLMSLKSVNLFEEVTSAAIEFSNHFIDALKKDLSQKQSNNEDVQ